MVSTQLVGCTLCFFRLSSLVKNAFVVRENVLVFDDYVYQNV